MLRLIVRRTVVMMTGLGLLLFPGTATLAQAETETVTFKNVTESFPDVNPCTGDPAVVTITYNGVLHISEDATGGFHITGTLTGTFFLDVDDPALPDYSGRFTQWFGGNHNSNVANETFTFSARGTGTDGSRLRFNFVAHITADTIDFSTDPPTVSGVKVMFERETSSCP